MPATPAYGQAPPPSYGQPPQYGEQPPGAYPPPPAGGYEAVAAPKTSTLAIISLVLGIVGLLCCNFFVVPVIAIITAHFGQKEIAESGGAKTGAGLAKAGMVLGIVGVALGALFWVLRMTGSATWGS